MHKKQVEEILLYIKNDPVKVWDLYQRINENLKYIILELSRKQYFKWCDYLEKFKSSTEESKVLFFSVFCLYMEFTKTEMEMFKTLGLAEYIKKHEN